MKNLILNEKTTWFERCLSSSNRGDAVCALYGVSDSLKAFSIGSFSEKTKERAIVVCPDEAYAMKIMTDYKSFFPRKSVSYIPARDFNFRSAMGVSKEFELMKLSALGKELSDPSDAVFITAAALLQLVAPPEVFSENSFTLSEGDEIALSVLSDKLLRAGYTKRDIVDGVAQFSMRGGIVDIFPTASKSPVRIEFWGDEIDSISYFGLESLRREERLESITVCPASECVYDPSEMAKKIRAVAQKSKNEALKGRLIADAENMEAGVLPSSSDKYMRLAFKPSTVFDYFGNSSYFIAESKDVFLALDGAYKSYKEDMKLLLEEGELSSELLGFCEEPNILYERLKSERLLLLDTFLRQQNEFKLKDLISSDEQTVPKAPMEVDALYEETAFYTSKGYSVALFCGNEKAAKVVCDDLIKRGADALVYKNELLPSKIYTLGSGLSAGFTLREQKIAVLTLSAVTVSSKKKLKYKKGKEIESHTDLIKGEAVVHSVHGIGIFDSIQCLTTGGVKKDYLKIKYAGADVLYVPITQLDLVSKYIGPKEDSKIKLNKLNSTEWQATKSRVKRGLMEYADELIELYSKRQNSKGFSFFEDCDWQREFEERFEYEETDDQLRCAVEIKSDMQKSVPMDRLLCGDVGFGKTEVALRAAFKAVLSHKQVAILVPTTILASQHYQTAKKRFADYPVEIEMLSRFRTPKEQKKIIEKLKEGKIDILIGTHRLIQKDVEFFDLGLVIIDEEQRFGVAHKEKLKEAFLGVDVLTLSATPIPRTLNMALTGIRDMSVIEEPPADRFPVQSYVIEEDDAIIADAIRKEMRRGGGVFFMHNRIDSIVSTAARIGKLVPEARIGIAHGKMTEDELTSIFESLINGDIDVLVCTTIIETGIDLPNCNTLIIEDADKMGLSQLYQIRGRVGRSNRRAYAYFMFRPGKVMTEVAYKRLLAIRDFTQFGSGFKIAMRDLEIRGAGNILSASQHGHMENVGYDMYVKLLNQAVLEKKGEKPAGEDKDCLIDINMNAYIPESYIDSTALRIEIYKKIASIKSPEDKMDVLDELIDRFGEPPEAVLGLMEISLLRGMATKSFVYEIKEAGKNMLFYINDIDMERVSLLISEMPGRILVGGGAKPYISVKKEEGKTSLELIRQVLDTLTR